MNFRELSRLIAGKREALFRGSPLRIALFSGIILLFIVAVILIIVFFAGDRSRSYRGEGGFSNLLREYDRAAAIYLERREFESLNRELDRLEKQAGTVETWLSIVKRRRHLARLDPYFVPAWRQSARRAALAYPWSEPIAAVAAEVLIHEAAITREAETELRSYLRFLTDPLFSPMSLSVHVLLGDLRNPERAVALLPRDLTMEQVYTSRWRAMLPSASEAEALAVDFAVIRTLRGDIAGAAAEIQSVLSGYAPGTSVPPSDDFVRFAAEFCYDFADPSRSAELFSLLPGTAALSRQADALWLAGYSGSARIIWTILSTPEPMDSDSDAPDDVSADAGINARSLYNLALTAETPGEAAELLGHLIVRPVAMSATVSMANGDLASVYGYIRYSRFFDALRAIALLETGKAVLPSTESAFLLIDLEILKRQMEIMELGRLAAETWLLLGRYPEAENLYIWAAWYFALQRNYDETAVLLKTAARHQFSGVWIQLHEALQLIRENNLDRAGDILAAIPAETADWQVTANLGRILEARYSPARAIEKYETAVAALAVAALPGDRETASRIQVRIAQCLKSLGRDSESRRVLEYALDLNPNNLNARLELHR